MRVLQIMASCSTFSGVAQAIMSYYRNIHESITFDFLLYTKVQSSFEQEIRDLGGNIYYIEKPSLKSYKQYENRFAEIIDTNKYDYVELNEIALAPFIFSVLKNKNIKSITHAHASKFSEYPIKSIRNKFLIKWAIKYSDYFFACSKLAGTRNFGKRIVNSKRFFVINNALNICDYAYSEKNRDTIRKELNLINEKIILHVGRMSPAKNQSFLINILKKIIVTDQSFRLVLVGKGPNYIRVKKKVKKYKLEKYVYFLQSRKDISFLLSSADIFAFPSKYEGLGIALIEAQANGLPCVASSNIPLEAIILKNCYRIDLNNKNGWINQIVEQAGNRCDNPFEAIRKAGFEIAGESEKLIKLYTELV